MSEIADTAVVRIFIADYAASDSANKLNIIGGGVNTVGIDPGTGQTAPFSLVVSVAVPAAHYNEESAVELVLEGASGEVVSLPGPSGEGQLMRIAQAVKFEEPRFPPGIHVPRKTVRARSQWVINFAAGLPLAVGQKYVWRVKIDTHSHDDWTEEVYVPGPVPGPVLG